MIRMTGMREAIIVPVRLALLPLLQFLLLVLLLLMTACGGGLHPCVSWQTRELARCATITVAERHGTQGGRTIPLRVMILRSRMAPHDADPVFVFTGGPGLAATDLAGYATGALGDLRESRDVVLVDVRGTGGSGPLDCDLYEDAGRMQPFVAPMFPLEAVRRCATRLSAHADLTRYTTSIIADDIDDVRRALGYAQVNLFGVSYGSRLALAYMRQHPTVVRSVVLAAVSPPEAPVPVAASWAGQRALVRAFEACARIAECHATAPDPPADLRSLLARLRASPAQVRLWNWRRLSFETVTLTARGVAEWLWTASYDPDAIVRELPVVHLAAAGQAAGQYEELARRLARQGRQRRGGRSEGMMLSVLCAEDAPRLTGPDTSTAMLGAPVVAELVQACSAWPQGGVTADFGRPVRSDIPTLLLSGAFDPVTPPELAESARRSLPRARSYVNPAGGHGALDAPERALIVEFMRRPGGVDRPLGLR
jgi:pimeloyl-ACP methyl ester carboxylesterase